MKIFEIVFANWPMIAAGLGVAASMALVVARKTRTKADDKIVETAIDLVDQLPGVVVQHPPKDS